MTIEEAIAHAEWAADNCEGECSDEHRQLAEWLKELEQWKRLADGIDLRPASLMVPFQPNVNDLERENDRLKAENTKLWERVSELEELTDHRHYIPQERYVTLRVENAKLRELVRIAVKHCDSGTCDGCPIQGESGSCPYSDMARELGIEVEQ